jgi:predicted metal-dependent hydrolase
LGKKYTLCININTNISNDIRRITFHRGKFIVNVGNEDHKNIRILYEKWLEKRAAKLLDEIVDRYSKMVGLDHKTLKIKIRSQRKRVGSLGRNLTLNFNKNILHLPLSTIEYVVVHELCHVRIPSHSKKYWQLVAKIMTDYKQRKEWLEKNCQTIIS